MNPLTNVKNITKLNETELASGSIHKKSWHDMYKESAWIFIGGLQYDLTEGDILAVFSQYGEIVNINLVRDKKTGNSKGFCFLCYSNQKSTVLAVDNFNGIKLCNRTIRVDHVANYKPPKEDERDDELTKKLKSEGCAPKLLQAYDKSDAQLKLKKKKLKKEKKEKKKKKKDKKHATDTQRESPIVEIKQEKHDPGYEKYDSSLNRHQHAAKIKHREKSVEKSKGESSQTYDKYRSKNDRQYITTSKKSNMQYADNYTDKDRSLNKIKYKESEQHKEYFKENTKHISSSKSNKRKRSSSFDDDDTVKKHSDNIRHKGKDYQAKNRYSDSNKKQKNVNHSSSSSSDDDSSSSQSSSDDEKDKNKSKYTRENKYMTSGEKRSHEKDNKYKHYNRSGDSSYNSSKNKDYDKAKKYSEHKSKSKYQSDGSEDTDHKNHRKHKHDKR